MKNLVMLCGVSLFISVALWGQNTQYLQPYRFASKVKDAPITTVSNSATNNSKNRVLEVYYSEDFDSGLNGWVAAIQTGNVGFKLTNSGHQNSPTNTYQIPPLETETPTQWILVDSDADGQAGNAEAATLTSPVIDLALEGVTVGDYIQMEFDQFFPEWENDQCFIGVSTNGTDWTEKEINIGVGREARPNPEHITWDITDAVGANLSTVQLRFRWVGNWDYGWQIDNVKISELLESDLTVVSVYRNYDEGLTYSSVPLAHSKPLIIGAIVKNIGHIQQTGVGFSYEIKDGSNAVVSSGNATANLTFDNTDQDTILWETNYTPTSIGSYSIEITAISNETDDDPLNNLFIDDFYEITPYTFAVDYAKGTKEPISHWPTIDEQEKSRDAMFGNLFYFKQSDVVSAIEVEIANNPSIVGESVYTIVGHVNISGGGEWVYDGIYESSVALEDLGNIKTIGFEGGYPVNSNELYLFMVGHYGWGVGAEPEAYFMRQGDILFNNRQGIDADLNGRGFFDRKAPIVRLRVNPDEVSIANQQLAEFAFYPNPATEELNMIVSASHEDIQLVIRDMTGNLVHVHDFGMVSGGNSTQLDVSNYARGVYFVEMIGETNHLVKKFVKN